MATVNDTGDVRGAAQAELDKLASADIDDRDREAIERFVTHRRTHGTKSGGYSPTTERDDLSKLRLSAERAGMALTDMGIDDINQLHDTLTTPKADGGYGIERGIDAYTRVWRVFYNWLDDHGEYDDYSWWEQVKTGNVDFPKPSDRDFPTESDIEAIKKAAGQHGTMRDVALVAFFADSAVRRTLGAQLRVADVDLAADRLLYAPGAFRPNPDGVAQKDVEQKWYPLFDCVAELRTWINNYHPDPNNPDAPLWTHPDYDSIDNPAEAALSSRHINRIFNKYAERAGVENVEHKPHAYRHAAVGRMKERGYSLSQVQRRTAWRDSAAAEMWGKYGDPDDSALDAGIAEHEGQDIPDDPDADAADAKPPERRKCGNCKLEGVTSDFCPQCGGPVSPDAQAEQSERIGERQQLERDIGATLAMLSGEAADEDVEELAADNRIVQAFLEERRAAGQSSP